MISNNSDYDDLGAAHFLTGTDPARRARRLVGQLHQLGYEAILNPVQ